MAKFYEALDEKLIAFIEAQPMFFIATAAPEGRINLSPKGLDTLRVLSPRRVAYLDLTGSGNETAAHARVDGRATMMFSSFTRNPLILRLYGRVTTGAPRSALWSELAERFAALPGARQIVAMSIESVQTSCGFGVPLMRLESERATLTDYWLAKGEAETEDYRKRENSVSIDGLPGWGAE
jgi:hypothetical protein